jgi:hypothetical protein
MSSQLFLDKNGNPALNILPAEGTVDRFVQIEHGVWRWEREAEKPVHEMRMEFETTFTPSFTMIPGLSYNGNGWGDTPEYVGDRCDGVPWTFAWHRCMVPACTYSAAKDTAVVLMGDRDEKVSCSFTLEGNVMRHSLLWPEQEGPKTLHRHFWEGPYQGTMEGCTVFRAIVAVFPIENPKTDYRKLLDFSWRYYGHPLKASMPMEALYRYSIAFIKNLWTKEKSGFIGFNRGLHWDEETGAYIKMKMTNCRYEAGWIGQNISLACALLWEYLRSGDRDALEKGIGVLDSWTEYAVYPNGLMDVKFDRNPYLLNKAESEGVVSKLNDKAGQNENTPPNWELTVSASGEKHYPIDACNLGGAAYWLFCAEELAEKAGIPKPKYAKIAKDICDFVLSKQKENGAYSKSWNPDGSVIKDDGTVGCFLIDPVLRAFEKTSEKKYLDSAVKAFEFYYRGLEENGFTTAGALDTYCIDKESSSPLLSAALGLYRVTGDKKYIAYAETTAWYLSTWMMHFSVQYPEGSVLKTIGYDTLGGTSVSTAHTVLDQYGLHDVVSFLKLAELTGNDQWRERGLALWYAASQLVSDGTLCIKGRIRPTGSQDEAVAQTRWRRPNTTTFTPIEWWMPAWPCAFRMEIFRTLANWDILENGLCSIAGAVQ